MLNFTVGPVQSEEFVLDIGHEQVPYFRTPEFSDLMLENARLINRFAKAGQNARTVFLTGSGTAAMEAAVMHTLTGRDKALVVNGGSFGQRFVQLCRLHGIAHEEICPMQGEGLTEAQLAAYDEQGFTAFLVNIHETSTGVLYDLNLISEFCRRNHLFLIVDAISSFLADPIDMCQAGIDILLAGSQKALACPPGVSLVVMSERALERVDASDTKCMYLDLKDALKNGERGQTPFTPAVSVLIQINARLKQINAHGGVGAETERIARIAADFREKIVGLPFEIASQSLSNAVTPLHPLTASAYDIFTILKDEYGIWVCPNGGELRDKIFRVGHIGALKKQDNTTLVNALKDLKRRQII